MTTIIEINDAIMVLDELISDIGKDRASINIIGKGSIMKKELIQMKADLNEAKLKRVEQIIDEYSKIE